MPGQIYPAWVDLLLAEDAANAQKPSACPPAEKAVQVSQGSSVTGCPFSAVVENETTQTLADGTHIQNTVKVLVYRDSLGRIRDRKSTRLNSSHVSISYAVFCLKKKIKKIVMLIPRKIIH